METFTAIQVNPKQISVTQVRPRVVSSVQAAPRRVSVIHTSPKLFTIGHSPRAYTVQRIANPVWWAYTKQIMSFLWLDFVYADTLVSCYADRRKITITGKDFSGVVLPAASAATFRLQADADFIVDDEADGLWFDSGGVQREVTMAEMVAQDYSRTVIKYAVTPPYDVTGIGLLRAGVVLTPAQVNWLSRDFWLWLMWADYINGYGYIKNNRTL